MPDALKSIPDLPAKLAAGFEAIGKLPPEEGAEAVGRALGNLGFALVPVTAVAGGAAKALKITRVVQGVRGMKALQKVLPNTKAFLKSADTIWKQGAQGKLTNAGRALQKHAGRKGSAFSNIKFSGRTANKEAKKIIQEIMNSKNRVIKVNPNGTTTIFDEVSKRGFNVSREGLFNGFRNME